jgi:phosphopantothenoylcysteine decarboxylase/phosphopantothenate--cysteine ligase
MVANDVSAPDSGFEVDTNRALLLGADGSSEATTLLTKEQLAGVVLERVVALLGGPAVGSPL